MFSFHKNSGHRREESCEINVRELSNRCEVGAKLLRRTRVVLRVMGSCEVVVLSRTAASSSSANVRRDERAAETCERVKVPVDVL
jgi:hypothetical protein